MLCGLQGSGKTTTCGKLGPADPASAAASRCSWRPTCSGPRPSSSCRCIGEQLGVPVYAEHGRHRPGGRLPATRSSTPRRSGADVVILDTAGRLHIDEELMDAAASGSTAACEPEQVYLVVDAMTGQDAVNSAKAFNEALELDGVIMTKLDGDARGGAALSVKAVTGVPIKFIGTGEHLDALEEFHPDRMAGRILGMGDILIAGRAGAAEVRPGGDGRSRRPGSARASSRSTTSGRCSARRRSSGRSNKMHEHDPRAWASMAEMMGDVDAEEDMRRLVGIIDSMTPDERRNPKKTDRPEPPPPHRGRGGRRAARGQRAGQAVRRHGRHDEADVRHGHARPDAGRCSSSARAAC